MNFVYVYGNFSVILVRKQLAQRKEKSSCALGDMDPVRGTQKVQNPKALPFILLLGDLTLWLRCYIKFLTPYL